MINLYSFNRSSKMGNSSSTYAGKRFIIHHYQCNEEENDRTEFYTDFFHWWRPYWVPANVNLPSFAASKYDPIDIVYDRKTRQIIVFNGTQLSQFEPFNFM